MSALDISLDDIIKQRQPQKKPAPKKAPPRAAPKARGGAGTQQRRQQTQNARKQQRGAAADRRRGMDVDDRGGGRASIFERLGGGAADDATVTVRNVGAVDSDEVVLAFMIPPRRTGVPTPKKQLLDFERVHVAKGASVDVSFEINAEQLELVSADGVRAHHAGRYTLLFTNGVDANASVVVTVE